MTNEEKLKTLIEYYRKAEQALQSLLEEAARSGQLGKQQYLEDRLVGIRAIIARLLQLVGPLFVELVHEAYRDGSKAAADALERLGVEGVDRTLSDIDERVVGLLVENAVERLKEVTTMIGRRSEDLLRRVAVSESAAAAIRGDTVQDRSKAILVAAQEAGMTYQRDGNDAHLRFVNVGKPGGPTRNLRADYWAEMTARTTMREARSHATKARLLQNDFDVVTVSEHKGVHDGDVCLQYAGRTFSLTGATKEFRGAPLPVLDRMPPFHPNCVHVLTPGPLF